MAKSNKKPKFDIPQISTSKTDFSLMDQKSIQPLEWDLISNDVIAHITFESGSNDVIKYISGHMTAGFDSSTMKSIVLGDTDPFNDEFFIKDYAFPLMYMNDPWVLLVLISKSAGDLNLKLNFDFLGPNAKRQTYPLKISPNERLDMFIPVDLGL